MNNNFEINRILIPYDFSETSALSLEHGIFLAKFLRAEVKLLHVIETMGFTSAISNAFSGFEKKIESESNAKLEEIAAKYHQETGVTIVVGTEVGRIYKKIASSAHQWHADIIFMGTHGASGHKNHVVGTNTVRVIAEAKCPVISVQSHAKKLGFTNIVLPIDDSANSRQKVPMAMAMARIYQSKVFIIAFEPLKDVEDSVFKFKFKIEQVEDYMAEHDIITETKFAKTKEIAQETLAFAKEVDADLIVIMTEQEFSLTGNSLGAFANKIINSSPIPVITVQPQESNPDNISVGY
ncbi:MAG: universal stress protein [Bacteroidetes bacterium]|nr:universal stress protein [Bacteroidota bacterium]MBL0052163.1 universal stress protein [Bacteroidota bacterium]